MGVTQRIMRSSQAASHLSSGGVRRHGSASSLGRAPAIAAAAGQLPSFAPVPESQPVLPVLLRRLLQRGASREALALAQRHQGTHSRRYSCS